MWRSRQQDDWHKIASKPGVDRSRRCEYPDSLFWRHSSHSSHCAYNRSDQIRWTNSPDFDHIFHCSAGGPLFFAATNYFNQAFANLDHINVLILPMRNVPLIDVSGLEALNPLHEQMRKQGKYQLIAGVHREVLLQLERGQLVNTLGIETRFWGAGQAILAAEGQYPCPNCPINNDQVISTKPSILIDRV